MKKRNTILCLLLAALLLLATAACTSTPAVPEGEPSAPSAPSAAGEAPSEGAASGESVKVGFSIQDLSNPIWAAMYQRMEEKAAELGVELAVNDAKNDTNSQINAIENFITMGCQSIIVHAFDYEAAKPAVDDAMAKGIKVISYDVNIEGADVYCGLDNFATGKKIGEMAGKWINENLGGEAVVGVCGYPRITVIVERENGIMAGLEESAPNARVVANVTAGYTPEGVTQGENFLQAHPDMNVVVGINDAGILGVYEAFKAAGKTGDDVALFGCDAVVDALDAIKEGSIYRGTISDDTVNMGAVMVEVAYDMVVGNDYPTEILMTPVEVDINNVDEFYDTAG